LLSIQGIDSPSGDEQAFYSLSLR